MKFTLSTLCILGLGLASTLFDPAFATSSPAPAPTTITSASAARAARTTPAIRVRAPRDVKPVFPVSTTAEIPVKTIDGVEASIISKPPKCPLKVKKGYLVALEYELRIDGKLIDSHENSKGPLIFIVGTGHAIAGLDEGIRGMCEGERRKLKIDSKLAYAEKGFRDIPPNSNVEFTIEVVHVEQPPNLFAEIDTNRDKKIDREELKKWFLNIDAVSKDDVDEAVEGVFKAEDLNKDGFISFDEFSGPKGI